VIPCELPDCLIRQGEGVFRALTEVERAVVRMHADGLCYEQIGAHTGASRSSVASAMQRACRKVGVTPQRMSYLVGIHDARAHGRALREETVHVTITRNGTVNRYEV
jgi:DNA-binding NarL/FixJ family response regulator